MKLSIALAIVFTTAAASGQLGRVAFSTSCNAAARPLFNNAVALLHSFEFGRAIDGFTATLQADPSCAIAEWGIALSDWGNPFGVGVRPAPVLRLGNDAVRRARTIGPRTERERLYVDAVAKLYEHSDTVDQVGRLVAYRDAMAALAAAYPDDTEAAIFHALSMAVVAAAEPPDPSYAEALRAGAILEHLFAKMPEHPGLAHYIIHAYDYPPLAGRAIAAARRYSTIAPDSPHALHMPSHTFTRVGAWQESIDANLAAADAARRHGVVGEELHTMDYRVYAYLQTAQDENARALLDALPGVAARYDPHADNGAAPPMAAYFAIAAIPARVSLERGAWADAVALTPTPTDYPFTEALTYLARAVGGGHTGDRAVIESSIDALTTIGKTLASRHESYWAGQTEIQRHEAIAWLAFADTRTDVAIAELRTAAELEDKTEKSAVTPGPLAPAREMLGDVLLQLQRPAEALKEFEATLKREPNRFRSLYGAAKAASLSGDGAKARSYYTQLVKICGHADTPPRAELAEAREALVAGRLRAPFR